jgi:anti-sigma B factor antagonist
MHTMFEAPSADTAVVRVRGDLDAYTASDLRQQLFAALDSGFRRLVLDMSECAFVDSTGLGVIVVALKRVRGGALVIVSPSPELRRVLRIVGLDRVLPTFASSAEAMRRAL